MKDIIIIGGGPAGLTAALYASRAGADVTIIESGAPGGKLNLTAHIENYPGIKEMMGPQLAYDMYEQALNFGAQLKMTEVKSIVDEGDYKKVITSKEELEARVVIIATGTKERKMGLHLEDEMTGKGISYCAVCDGPFFRGKEVAVIGGGNSAIEESIYLAGITEKVHIIMRRDVFRADDYLVKKALNNEKIEFHFKKKPHALIVEDDTLKGLELEDSVTKELENLYVQGIFPFIGLDPMTQCAKSLGIAVNFSVMLCGITILRRCAAVLSQTEQKAAEKREGCGAGGAWKRTAGTPAVLCALFLFPFFGGLLRGGFIVQHADGGVFLLRQLDDGLRIGAGEEQRLFHRAVADVQTDQIRVLTVLGDDGIDLLPGEEVVLGRDLHLIEDLKSAGGDHGVLLRQKRQRIQKG